MTQKDISSKILTRHKLHTEFAQGWAEGHRLRVLELYEQAPDHLVHPYYAAMAVFHEDRMISLINGLTCMTAPPDEVYEVLVRQNYEHSAPLYMVVFATSIEVVDPFDGPQQVLLFTQQTPLWTKKAIYTMGWDEEHQRRRAFLHAPLSRELVLPDHINRFCYLIHVGQQHLQ